MNFEKAIESVKSIRLTGGIFGKTTSVLIVLIVCVALVSYRIATWWFALLLMFPLIGLVFYCLKRCLDFAEKNPEAAIMEGAEYLVHERILHGRKGLEELPVVGAVTDHNPPHMTEAEVISEDPPPSPTLDGKATNEEGI